MRQSTAIFLVVALAAPMAVAQYRTGTVYVQTQTTEYPQSSCGGTVYDPEVFVLPDGDLQMYAQGPHNGVVDTFYGFRRTQLDGQWTGPKRASPGAATPAVVGQSARCGYSPSGITGPIASPSVTKVGDRYYMALSGGNADAITGRVYWATSTDGLKWSYYDVNAGNELIAPIIYPLHHEVCAVDPLIGGSGVGQVELVYDDGYFIMWLRYGHDADGRIFDAERIAFRIQHDPNSPWGLGRSWQIWYDGAWRNHSGRLVWDYDRCGGRPCLPVAGDFVLGRQRSVRSMKFGPGDVKYDPQLFYRGYWVHFSQRVAGEPIEWEYSDLSTPEWTPGGELDVSTILEAYPGGQLYYPGAYFSAAEPGRVGGNFIFIPVDPGNACARDYGGTRIVCAQLLKTPRHDARAQ